MAPGSPWVFLTAAVSLIPLAGMIGLGTEQLARRSGPALGGFLNATFGNAAELIIAVVALATGPRRARQGVDHRQHRRQPPAGARPVVLRRRPRPPLAEVPPHGRHQHRRRCSFSPSSRWSCRRCSTWRSTAALTPRPPAIDRLSFWSALVLIGAYAGSLIYAFTAQRDLFRAEPRRRARRSPRLTDRRGGRRCSPPARC